MSRLPSIAVFDTHAHLDLEPFAPDLDEVVRRIDAGEFPPGFVPEQLDGRSIEMAGVLLPGIDAVSSRRCVELSGKSPRLYAAVAIHPNSVAEAASDDWETIVRLASRDDVVAIGETGLDRYWDRTPFDLQIQYFRRHIELSGRTGKPILIHCRDAWDDLLPILRETASSFSGVIHAFSGTPEQAAEAVRLGFMVSFAGSLTYRNEKFSTLREAARIVPIERLLVETDAPFMAPHPFRGRLKRNEPSLAVLVALRLAELRDESLQCIAGATTANARRILNI